MGGEEFDCSPPTEKKGAETVTRLTMTHLLILNGGGLSSSCLNSHGMRLKT